MLPTLQALQRQKSKPRPANSRSASSTSNSNQESFPPQHPWQSSLSADNRTLTQLDPERPEGVWVYKRKDANSSWRWEWVESRKEVVQEARVEEGGETWEGETLNGSGYGKGQGVGEERAERGTWFE
ncbi:hypothetical protein MMC10_009016 [Thelotrema lepadinum]|nr:hypothetical protein [Thelotrema lepadinum]